MLFNSYIFIFLFLPLALAGYYGLNHFKQYKLGMAWLIGMSMWFYGYNSIHYLFILIVSILLNYLLVEGMSRVKRHKSRQLLMIVGILLNLGILFYYKYYDFFIENVNAVLKTDIHLLRVVLPLGISFYTFQQLSYVIDYYRQDCEKYSLLEYAAYVSFFPQLIAGPIVYHNELIPQFRDKSRKKIDVENFSKGIYAFVLGLAKKVLIADTFSKVVTIGYQAVGELNSSTILLVMVCYSLQIYFDFSGYSDMAVGLGKMFGFEFCMNFNYPYIAKSITEFWRRWHISLSSWFRDYVYIPLGGNRVSKSRHIFNLMVVWFLTGLWHGAAWNFVAWGLYYGIILIIEKYILSPVLDKLPSVVRHIYSIVLVVIGWVLFFSPSLGGAARYLGMMFGAGAHGVADRESLYLLTTNLVLWIILIIGSTPLTDVRYQHMLRQKKWNTTLLNGIVYAVLFILCIAYLVTETYNPFLYFRF